METVNTEYLNIENKKIKKIIDKDGNLRYVLGEDVDYVKQETEQVPENHQIVGETIIKEEHPIDLDTKNALEKDDSNNFFNVDSIKRGILIKKGISRVQEFAKFLVDNEISDYDTYDVFIEKQDQRMLLKKYFGLTDREFATPCGIKIKNYVRPSFQGEYIVFNYSESFFFSSINKSYTEQNRPEWTLPLRVCRTLVIRRDTNEVSAFQYEKFFNIDEYYDGKIDFLVDKCNHQSYIASEKVDGISIILFYDRNTEDIAVTTKTRVSVVGEELDSSDSSNYIRFAREILNKKKQGSKVSAEDTGATIGSKYDLIKASLKNERICLLCELVHPEAKVVVDYKDKRMLVLHGVRKLDDYSLMSVEDTQGVADRFGLERNHIEKFNSFSDIDDFRKKFTGDFEGFVLRFEDGSFSKVKTIHYFHKMKGYSKLSYKAIGDSILNNEDWNLFKIDKIRAEELFPLADKLRENFITTTKTYNEIMISFIKSYMTKYAVQVFEKNEKNVNHVLSCFAPIVRKLQDDKVISGLNLVDFDNALCDLLFYYTTKKDKFRVRYNKQLVYLSNCHLQSGNLGNKWMGNKIDALKESVQYEG